MTAGRDPECELEALGERLEQLAELCRELRRENRRLKAQINDLSVERDRYLAQSRSARERVKQMLERLQSLNPPI